MKKMRGAINPGRLIANLEIKCWNVQMVRLIFTRETRI
jgi:hypothetical protein